MKLNAHSGSRGYRYLVCAFSFLVGCCILASGGCASTRGSGAERAEKINDNLDSAVKDLSSAEDLVDRSNATPEQKAAIKSKIESGKQKVHDQKPAITKIGTDVDVNKKIADENKADAEAYHAIIWTVSIIGIALLILAVIFRRQILSLFTKGAGSG